MVSVDTDKPETDVKPKVVAFAPTNPERAVFVVSCGINETKNLKLRNGSVIKFDLLDINVGI
jgi:hypothetical protein